MAKLKTLVALVEEASSIADETYNNKDWVAWFNNGLDDLSDILYFDKEVELTAVAGKFPLPIDFKAVINVAVADNDALSVVSYSDKTLAGYKIVEENIVLQGYDDNNITLYYYRLPAYLSTASSGVPVDLPDLFTRALIYFACAQAMIKEDEPNRYDIFMGRYDQGKALIYKASKNKTKGKTGVWQVVR